MNIKIRQLSIGLTLVAVVMLASCGQKQAESPTNTSENATPSAPAENPMAGSPSNNTESMSKHPGASKIRRKAVVPAAALKLGVAPTGETICPSDSPVKGKVTKKRGNIYHLAQTPDYDKVKPDICFKDKDTAEKAGFRAPRSSK
jgi:hypothetical protein